jgi:hypothetical protein
VRSFSDEAAERPETTHPDRCTTLIFASARSRASPTTSAFLDKQERRFSQIPASELDWARRLQAQPLHRSSEEY